MADKPKIFRTAYSAWIEVARAISAMPLLVIVAVAAFVIYQIVSWSFEARVPQKSSADVLLDALLETILNFFLTPINLAIHRFVILGEVTRSYSLDIRQRRFLMFFAWTTALNVLFVVLNLMLSAPPSDMKLIVNLVVFALVCPVILVRLTLLFPAIAVDAPGASVKNSFQDTFGHFWRIFGILFVTAVPVIAVILLLHAIGGDQLADILRPISSTAFTALMITAASRLYMAMGDFLKRPASQWNQ